MTDAPPRTLRQPKLRSSCDGCGAAKLRCDRGQPECGRCLSLGLGCVYGVSQKMGKPPRERLRTLKTPSSSRASGKHPRTYDRDRNGGRNNGTGRFDYDATDAGDGYPDSFTTSVGALGILQSNLFGSLPPDFTSPDFDDGLSSSMDIGPVATLGSPELEDNSTLVAQTESFQTQAGDSICIDGSSLTPTGSKDHDCFREAYDILGSLPFHSFDNAHSISQSPPGSASTTTSTADRVPLDHALHLHREASERLSRLLTCICARSPHLTMLYASIISRVLNWYQQAAGCTQSASWSSASMTLNATSHHPSVIGSTLNSGSGIDESSTWPSTAAATFGTDGTEGALTLTRTTELTVAPAKMAIGTFNVDDLRVQTALKIQLISGEMRRAGRLIDLFSSYNSGGKYLTNEYTSGGVESLYQGLDSWLRGEHSRIANTMRLKLRELNT